MTDDQFPMSYLSTVRPTLTLVGNRSSRKLLQLNHLFLISRLPPRLLRVIIDRNNRMKLGRVRTLRGLPSNPRHGPIRILLLRLGLVQMSGNTSHSGLKVFHDVVATPTGLLGLLHSHQGLSGEFGNV
jgi:hypothetical protein